MWRLRYNYLLAEHYIPNTLKYENSKIRLISLYFKKDNTALKKSESKKKGQEQNYQFLQIIISKSWLTREGSK